MKEKVKKGWLVACACTCAGLLFAGSALLLPRSENALAAEVPDAKVYYYVDCGNYVDNEEGTGNFVYRDANGNDKTGHPSTQTTGWMTAHNLEFGTSTNHGAGENVLYNSVTDKAFGLDGTEADTEKTNGTGKKWGFISNDSEMNRWSYGWTHKDIPTPENKDQTGFNTARFQKPANAGGEHFQYKFQVDNNTDDLAVIVGTKKVEDWGGSLKTKIYVNGADSGDIASEPGDELTYFYTAKGVEEAGEYYITLKFGEKPNDEVHVAWILIATGNHETIKTYPGKPATTYAGYAQEGVDKVYVKPYALPVEEITLDQSNKDKINAAESFADVTLNFATSGDNAKDFTYAVIPKETVYFINASPADDGIMATYSDVYSSEKGYGRKEGNSNGGTFWADEPFDQSTLGGELSETFEYQFDLEKGTYAFAIGTYGRWNQTRIMNVTIGGALKGELTSRPETAEHGTFYHTVEQADGKKTIDVSITNKEGQDQGYQFAYILVYKVNRITYDEQGGSEVEDDYFEIGTTFTLNTAEKTTTRTGYKFDKWVTEASGDTAPETSYSESTTLYAKWTAKTYTVKLNAGDHGSFGDSEKTVEATFDQALTISETPTANKGYEFKGWKHGDDDFTSGNNWTFDEESPELTAVYEAKNYTIKWTVGTEGDLADGAEAQTTAAFNSDVTIPEVTAHTGKTFKGWFSGETKVDSKEALWGLVKDNTTSEITLTAQYDTAKTQVTFEVGAHGETTNSQTYTYGQSVTLPTPTAKTGYEFKGWFKEADFQNEVKDGEWKILDETLTLHAKFEAKTYTVKFDGNKPEDASDVEVQGVPENATVSLDSATVDLSKKPTLEGYEFKGWTLNGSDVVGDTFTLTEENIPQDGTEITLKAKWEKIPEDSKTVTFASGVSDESVKGLPDEAHVKAGSYNIPDQEPTRTGYTFAGWKVGDDDTLYKKGTEHATYNVSADVTFTAQWTAKQTTVTFNQGDHGTLATGDGSKTYTYDQTATLPTPTPAKGYEFKEWQLNSKKFELGADNKWNKEDPSLTLTAVYTAKTYNFTWTVGNDGTIGTAGSANAAYDSTVTLPTVTANAGKKFEGWYIGETKIENAQAIWTYVAAHESETTVTFTAKYSDVKYTVHFNSNEGSAVADVTNVAYNTKITAPTDPTREGYTFGGWYKDEACTQKFDFENDKITEETTLHAKWTAVSTETPGDSGSTDNGTTDNNAGNTDNGSSDKTEEKNGCGSAIAAPVAMIASAVLMVGVALVIRKKHSEN